MTTLTKSALAVAILAGSLGTASAQQTRSIAVEANNQQVVQQQVAVQQPVVQQQVIQQQVVEQQQPVVQQQQVVEQQQVAPQQQVEQTAPQQQVITPVVKPEVAPHVVPQRKKYADHYYAPHSNYGYNKRDENCDRGPSNYRSSHHGYGNSYGYSNGHNSYSHGNSYGYRSSHYGYRY
jgi:hypothetical protein